MSLKLVSTSRVSVPCARFCKVMGRSRIAHLISEGQIFACKDNGPGFTGWSQHAYGNAVDLMCAGGPGELKAIADEALRQRAPTIINVGWRLPIAVVIYEQLCWDSRMPQEGWHHYGGAAHTNHVHVDFQPWSFATPRCAGGTA